MNVPRPIFAVVSNRMATLAELDSDLGPEHLYDLLEVLTVDNENRRMAAEAAAKK